MRLPARHWPPCGDMLQLTGATVTRIHEEGGCRSIRPFTGQSDEEP